MTIPEAEAGAHPSRTETAEGSGGRRLHVLHVCLPTTGSVASALLEVLRDQADRGWSVALACPSLGPLGFAARDLGVDVRWWDPGAWSGIGVLREVRRLRRIAVGVRPDVVHLHGQEAGLVGRLLLRDRVPTLYEPRGWDPGDPGDLRDGIRWRRWERWARRWTAELVCADAEEAQRAWELGLHADRTSVVPPGVDVARWRAVGPGSRATARADLGLAAGPTAVCVGRLALDRGQQDLLVEWGSIRARVPDARLVLVGDGPDRDALRRLAAGLPGVSLVGPRSDVPSWLAAADVVVAPCRGSGVPLAVLEAMASARSVVVTGAETLATTVPPGTGAVVRPGDGAALAEAVAARLIDRGLADDEGIRGRRHVEMHHDAESSARELARIYPRLVASRRG